MSVVRVEGIVEGGVVRPIRPVPLAEGTRVYIVVPEDKGVVSRIESPRLVHPEETADFRMDVSEA